jgi:XFP N-terminal domain
MSGAADQANPLTDEELAALDAWSRAANYLSVGQIYLMGNPLLREPLRPEHVKPRLLGHWGTTPGLNFVYAHLNRAIRARDPDAMYVMGPGHGGPGPVAAAWLEGTYSEVYPDVSQPGHRRPGPLAVAARARCEPRTEVADVLEHHAGLNGLSDTSGTCGRCSRAPSGAVPTASCAQRSPARWPTSASRSTPTATGRRAPSATSASTVRPRGRSW